MFVSCVSELAAPVVMHVAHPSRETESAFPSLTEALARGHSFFTARSICDASALQVFASTLPSSPATIVVDDLHDLIAQCQHKTSQEERVLQKFFQFSLRLDVNETAVASEQTLAEVQSEDLNLTFSDSELSDDDGDSWISGEATTNIDHEFTPYQASSATSQQAELATPSAKKGNQSTAEENEEGRYSISKLPIEISNTANKSIDSANEVNGRCAYRRHSAPPNKSFLPCDISEWDCSGMPRKSILRRRADDSPLLANHASSLPISYHSDNDGCDGDSDACALVFGYESEVSRSPHSRRCSAASSFAGEISMSDSVNGPSPAVVFDEILHNDMAVAGRHSLKRVSIGSIHIAPRVCSPGLGNIHTTVCAVTPPAKGADSEKYDGTERGIHESPESQKEEQEQCFKQEISELQTFDISTRDMELPHAVQDCKNDDNKVILQEDMELTEFDTSLRRRSSLRRPPLNVINSNALRSISVNIAPDESLALERPSRTVKKALQATEKAPKTTRRTTSKAMKRHWRELQHLDVARARKSLEKKQRDESGDSCDDNGSKSIRRSKRQRFPVLKYWRNETIKYERRKSQIMPTIAEITIEAEYDEDIETSRVVADTLASHRAPNRDGLA